jgi:hypothetical protein
MNFGGAVAANIAANVTTSNMSTSFLEKAGNIIYRGGIITGVVTIAAVAVDRLTPWKLPQLGKLTFKDLGKTLILISTGWGGYEYFVIDNKYISDKISYRSAATTGAVPAAATRSQS